MKQIPTQQFLSLIEAAFERRTAGLDIDTQFRELPEWDSLASVMIVAEVYENYGVQIAGEELESCRTLANLKDLVESKL